MTLPVPHDLQLGVLDQGQGLPSCLPYNHKHRGRANVKVEQPTQTFAVFVNTSFHLEASVTHGNQLTFTFEFDEQDEGIVVRPCVECQSVIQVRYSERRIIQIKTLFTLLCPVG